MSSTAPAAATPDGTQFRIFRRPVVSWALYDFANTIFSLGVITLYFNKWIITEQNNPDWYVGAASMCAAVLLVITLVPMGAIADRLGRRIPFLVAFTVACCVLTAALGFVAADATLLVLGIYTLAVFCYQSALAHYDPLLAAVAPPERQGSVSGFGVGMGYVGALVAFAGLPLIIGSDPQEAFLPTALLFLLFALPLFLFVREDRSQLPVRTASTGTIVREALTQLRETLRQLPKHPDLTRFLLARFLYADALLTVILYMVVYMNRVGDFSDAQENRLLGISIAFAAVGAFVAGRLVGRFGPKPVLRAVLVLFIVTLAAAAASGFAGLVWVLGPAVGIGLGAVWTSDRVLMMRLTPAHLRGELFGIYNLVGKLSSGLGPFVIWGGTVYLMHEQFGWTKLDASRAALGALAAVTVLGLLVLNKVRVPEAGEEQTWGSAAIVEGSHV